MSKRSAKHQERIVVNLTRAKMLKTLLLVIHRCASTAFELAQSDW